MFKKKSNILANRTIGTLTSILTIKLLFVSILNSEFTNFTANQIGVTVSFAYTYGPLLYIYINIIGKKLDRLPKNCYLHFIPFLIINIILLVSFLLDNKEFLNALQNNDQANFGYYLIELLKPVHGIIYTIIILIQLKTLKIRIKRNYSNLDISTYHYLKYLIIGSVAIWIVVAITRIDTTLFSLQITNLMIYIPVAILIFCLGWKSLSIAELNFVQDSETTMVKKPIIKSYHKSGLNKDVVLKHLQKLDFEMKNNKPFLDNNLKLSDLAKQIEITPHNLSEILNTHMNQTFYDFVNSYRVNEVKELIKLDKEKKLSLISLAFEAGFSSKSSFNTTFKKIEGLTPSAYRNEVLI